MFTLADTIHLRHRLTRLCLLQLTLTFREKDEAGAPIRRDVSACAGIMKLPQARVELMLHRALRAIPLAIDHDPIVVR